VRADVMLAWMSNIRSGVISELRERLIWLARVDDINPSRPEANRWLNAMSALGHVEVDWSRGTWAMATATAALLPSSGGTAVLCGSRPNSLVPRLESLISLQSMHLSDDDLRLAPPPAIFLQADSISELLAATTACGVTYVGLAGKHIADELQPVRLGQGIGKPPHDAELEFLDLRARPKWVKDSGTCTDGLYRTKIHNSFHFFYREKTQRWKTDLANGQLWALAQRGITNVISWRPERQPTSGADRVGTVFVDHGIALPPLQERSLVLCSGQTPKFGSASGNAIYRNIPQSVAGLVAESAGQELMIIR